MQKMGGWVNSRACLRRFPEVTSKRGGSTASFLFPAILIPMRSFNHTSPTLASSDE